MKVSYEATAAMMVFIVFLYPPAEYMDRPSSASFVGWPDCNGNHFPKCCFLEIKFHILTLKKKMWQM